MVRFSTLFSLLGWLVATVTVSAAKIARPMDCIPARKPTGDASHVSEYDLPYLDSNKRQLRTKDASKTPDPSMVYNAYIIYHGRSYITVHLENKSLVPRGTSQRHLVYEITVRTTDGPKSLHYYLDNTDSCKFDREFPKVDWNSNSIIDAKLYWIKK